MLRKFSTTLPLAMILAGPALAQTAPTEQDMRAMQQRMQALEAKLEQMQKLLDQRPAAPAAAAASGAGWGESAPTAKTQAEIDALKQKVARQELKIGKLFSDAFESAGSGLEITGYLDTAYVANRNLNSASFLFLNGDPYTYYNSTIGEVFLRIAKTFGEGLMAPKVDIQIAPSRGYGTGNVNSDGLPGPSIIHTALMTMPISDTTAVVAGYTPSFPGYEYFEATLLNTVSHNLLYDFAESSGMVEDTLMLAPNIVPLSPEWAM